MRFYVKCENKEMVIIFFMRCRISENKWRHLWNGWKSWRNRSRQFPCCRWVLTNFLFSHLHFRNVHRPACNLHPGELFRAKRSCVRYSRCFIMISLFLLWRIIERSRCMFNAQTRRKYEVLLVYFQRNIL